MSLFISADIDLFEVFTSSTFEDPFFIGYLVTATGLRVDEAGRAPG